jgi:hypothetical protein
MVPVTTDEGWAEATDPPVRVGFRLVPGSPLRVECTLVHLGDRRVYLAVTSDRSARRWADVGFEAVLDGVVLRDPAADAAFLGGPATGVLLEPGSSHRATVDLAEYVDLPDDPAGLLDLRCRREVRLHPDRDRVVSVAPVTVEVALAVRL